MDSSMPHDAITCDRSFQVSLEVSPGALPEVSQRDRFRGVLLGLWLVPVAVGQGSLERCFFAEQSVDVPLSAGFSFIRQFSLDSAAYHQPLADYLPALNGLEPSNLSSSLAPSLASSNKPLVEAKRLPCWFASVPALLRYYDDAERRLGWINAQQSSWQSLAEHFSMTRSQLIAQIVWVGNLLEMTLGGRANSLIDYLPCFQPYDHSYGGLPTANLEEVYQKSPWLACALLGAQLGPKAWPVLWQMGTHSGLSRSALVSMADGLFAQWAGCSSAMTPRPHSAPSMAVMPMAVMPMA
ncbi:MAG: hypothetical protein AAFN38_04570 [Cyanobacteria bacterium J06560_5]